MELSFCKHQNCWTNQLVNKVFKKIEFLFALKYLKSKKKDAFISLVSIFSLIGIALGVATLIIVMSVMNGYERELVTRILGINGHLNLTGYNNKVEDYQKTIDEIKSIKGVKYVTPTIQEQALAFPKYGTSGFFIRGM